MFSHCSYDRSVSGLGGSIFDIVYLATGEPSRFALEGGAEGLTARVFQRKVEGNPRGSAAMRKVVSQFRVRTVLRRMMGVPASSAGPRD